MSQPYPRIWGVSPLDSAGQIQSSYIFFFQLCLEIQNALKKVAVGGIQQYCVKKREQILVVGSSTTEAPYYTAVYNPNHVPFFFHGHDSQQRTLPQSQLYWHTMILMPIRRHMHHQRFATFPLHTTIWHHDIAKYNTVRGARIRAEKPALWLFYNVPAPIFLLYSAFSTMQSSPILESMAALIQSSHQKTCSKNLDASDRMFGGNWHSNCTGGACFKITRVNIFIVFQPEKH